MSTQGAPVSFTAIHESLYWITSLSASHYLFFVQNASTVYLPETFLLEVSRVIGSLMPQCSSTSWGSLLAFPQKKMPKLALFFGLLGFLPALKILHLWVTFPATIYPELLQLKKPDVLIIYLSQLTFSVEEIYIFQGYLILLKCLEIKGILQTEKKGNCLDHQNYFLKKVHCMCLRNFNVDSVNYLCA